ncbi:MAG: glycosyltransferase family 2 protein [Thermonemataceae bacterium]|nr:glycosyltransferase family 2 protein [Thermonemataceae bacterium]
MNEQSSVAVIILNFNGKKWLEQFLPPLLAHTPEANVIIADNASTDDSLHFIQTYFPSIQSIVFEKNLGFCEGYNQALSQIKATYFVLLNSDIEVSANWLAPLIQTLETEKDAVATQPKIKSFYQKNCFEYAGATGGFLDKWGYAFCRGRIFDTFEEDKGQYDEKTEIFWASGACMCIKADWWHKLGGFDKHFFAHFEEIDLAWRIHSQGGKIYYTPDSEVFHVGGGTLPKTNPHKTFLNYRNNLLTIYKNAPFTAKLWLIPLRLVLDGVSSILFLKKGEWANIWAVIKAHFSFYALVIKVKTSPKKSLPNFPKFIILEYFLRKKKKFSEL